MRRLLAILTLVSMLLGANGCAIRHSASSNPQPPHTVPVRTPPTISQVDVWRWTIAANAAIEAARWAAIKRWVDAAEAARPPLVRHQVARHVAVTPPKVATTPKATPKPAPPAVAPSIAAVMACIRAHESGNYYEHSHYFGSSGAYQYEPDTWRYYSVKAGYPGYEYAFEAPPAVQDAVTVYTLTHGGAHNWSPKYGDDPCTVNLP